MVKYLLITTFIILLIHFSVAQVGETKYRIADEKEDPEFLSSKVNKFNSFNQFYYPETAKNVNLRVKQDGSLGVFALRDIKVIIFIKLILGR